MRSLLIFCYILSFSLFISCGESADKKQAEETVQTVEVETQETADKKRMLFFGTSLTAGMGLAPEEAYPAVIQEKIDSLDLNYEVVNAGLSGETTASGKSRIDWVLNQEVDVFILELGANDGLRGIPLSETRKNLEAIIEFVLDKYPDVKIVLAGMQLPPNMGQSYTSEFKSIFSELAEKHNLPLIPFLLEDVGGVPDLNQPDGIHPTAEGQEIIAENVWEVLKPIVTE